jgi:hypothetical protein
MKTTQDDKIVCSKHMHSVGETRFFLGCLWQVERLLVLQSTLFVSFGVGSQMGCCSDQILSDSTLEIQTLAEEKY